MAQIAGLLVDIDGVLHIDGEPIPGAPEAFHALVQAGIPLVLLSNTTLRSRRELGTLLRGLGFPVNDEQIVTAARVAAEFVRTRYPGQPCYVLVEGSGIEEFADLPQTDGPEARVVVIGGAGESFTYARLNHAFRLLLNGAAFVAMHKGLSWQRRDGLSLDAGAFILGLEAASGVTAHVVGKPSLDFFRIGLAQLRLPASKAVAMVGDRLPDDILPAQALGLTGILVQTGAYRPHGASPEQPDVVLPSFAALPAWLRTGTA